MVASYFAEIYRYRGFIVGSVTREFSARYKSSMLGSTWLFLQPLAQILVYTLIFSSVMRARLPGVNSAFAYSIFLCSGILTWGFFAEILTKCQSMFLDSANLIKKLSFPRIILPIIVVINAAFGFAIIFGLFIIFLVVSGNFSGWPVLALVPLLAVMITFALGLGMVLGVLNVFFRDVGQFFNIMIQFWFWLTPVVYPIATLPVWAHDLLALNPMTALVTGFQTVLVQRTWPDWGHVAVVFVAGLALCLLGLHLFRTHSGEIVDEL